MRKRTHARESALQVLYQLDLTDAKISEALESIWESQPKRKPAEKEVKAYAESLVRGVADKQVELDEVIGRHADNWKIDRMACVDRNILRLASYEIIHGADVPPKVCINEAVELAKKFGDSDSSKFVNGILDKIAKSYGKSES